MKNTNLLSSLNFMDCRVSAKDILGFVEVFPFPIIFIDAKGDITAKNNFANNIFKNESFLENFLANEDKDIIKGVITRVITEKVLQSIVLSVGEQAYNLVFYPIKDDSNEILQIAVAASENNDFQKVKFFSHFSHDLRQPLQALGLLIDAISEYELDAFPKKVVGKIALALDNLSQLIDNSLYVSKLELGLIKPKQMLFPIGSIINAMANEYQSLADKKNIVIKTVSTKKQVFGDPVLIERIIRNLLSNSVRYTEKGKILVGCRLKNKKLRVEIHDTGAGISNEQLNKMFEEFVVISSFCSKNAKPTNLGLSIVFMLCNLMKTKISISSKVGVGTFFSFDLDYEK